MDRLALLDRIAVEYDVLLDEAGIIVADDPGALGTALDDVESIRARNPSVESYHVYDLFSYFVLDRIVTSLAGMFDVTVEGESFRLNQLYKNAVDLRDAKRKFVGWMVDWSGATGDDTFGNTMTIVMPFLGDERGW